jgi:hypothetical protein
MIQQTRRPGQRMDLAFVLSFALGRWARRGAAPHDMRGGSGRLTKGKREDPVMKSDVLRLYGIGGAIAGMTFLISLALGHSARSPAGHGTALDWAVLSLAISVILQSMVGLVVNNFIFLGAGKDWRDFWESDMLEYFHGVALHEKWRIARGRFILYFLGFFSGFLFIYLDGYLAR